jgi:hypothetical protein
MKTSVLCLAFLLLAGCVSLEEKECLKEAAVKACFELNSTYHTVISTDMFEDYFYCLKDRQVSDSYLFTNDERERCEKL